MPSAMSVGTPDSHQWSGKKNLCWSIKNVGALVLTGRTKMWEPLAVVSWSAKNLGTPGDWSNENVCGIFCDYGHCFSRHIYVA